MTEETVYVKPDPKNDMIQLAMDYYKTHFGKPLPSVAVYAPAKVTILGDHTEYIGGYTLNMSLPMYTIAIGAPNDEHTIKVVDVDVISKDVQKTEFPIPTMLPVKKGQPEWANLIKAAVSTFQGLILEGFNVLFVSDIPRGYGLGSSSSLIVCAYTFLESITKEWTMDLYLKASICAKAERQFTGVPEPYADCLAITMGQEGKAFFIDCNKKEATPISLTLDSYVFVVALVQTKVRSQDIMEKRRKECEQALAIVGVSCLADMQVAHLKVHKDDLASVDDISMRIRHVLAEHIRVSKGVAAINERNYLHLGRLMNQSQISARYDFDISNEELNSFIDLTLGVSGVMGTRMTGTGLGSSTVTLMRKNALNEILALLRRKLDTATVFIQADPCLGAGDISSKLYNLERAEARVAVGVFTQIEYGVEQYKLHYFDKNMQPTTAAYAPGRLPVLGEHCDANNGCVIQLALPMGTTVIGALNNSDIINIVVEEDVAGSEPTHATFILPSIAALESDNESWTNLFRAVMRTFHGKVVRGFDCIAVCSLPPIAGLGRTTSLVVAFYTFLECLYKNYISSNLEVNCQPFPTKEYAFLLCDSNLERTGAGLMFPGHQNECLELQEILGPLRLLTKEKLKQAATEARLSSGMLKRGTHIMKEVTRVYQGVRAIRLKDMQALGLLILQSHNSLVENYETSEWNQKQLVALAMAQTGVLGSKMTGSAYSSCTLTLVMRAHIKEAVSGIRCKYSGHVMVYEIDPKEGCQDVTRILQRELAKRVENLEIFEVELSEDTLETEDLDQLSWPMFDLDNEWQVWEKKRKGLPGDILDKSQESYRVVEEVLSEESEDDEEEIDEDGRKELEELRKSEMETKRLENLQKDISDIGMMDEEEVSSVSTAQPEKDLPDRR